MPNEAATGALSPAAIRPLHPGSRLHRAAHAGAARPHAQLLPTLFDRLRDDAPSQHSEAASDYTISPNQVRDIIQRDLTYLLNATNADDLISRERYPQAAASTLNFGVRPLAGSYLSQRRWADIERLIRRAIADFEPRLLAHTVTVLPLVRDSAGDAHNVLLFEIRAMIDLKPYPLELTVQSSVDLETNRMNVSRPSRGQVLHPAR
jgi:type VI secretion system protein ImpF